MNGQNAIQSSLTSPQQLLHRIRDWVLPVPRLITRPDQVLQIRVLSAINLVIACLTLMLAYFWYGQNLYVYLMVATTLLLITSYVLLRTRYYVPGQWAGFFALLLACSAVLYLNALAQLNGGEEDVAALMFMLVIFYSMLALSPTAQIISSITSVPLIYCIRWLAHGEVNILLGVMPEYLMLATAITGTHAVTRQMGLYREREAEQLNNKLNMALNRSTEAERRAQEANRLKSEFLATMSHELRTPLHAIIGYADVQLAGMAGTLPDEIKSYQERIMINAEHLLELINDILDISKIEAGRMTLNKKRFQVAELMREVLAQTKGLADQKNIKYDLEIDPSMPEQLTGDAQRIIQIMVNLTSNAIKFTEHGGVRIEVHREGDHWRLTVRDTGIGIPREAQEYIFDEFRQVDGSDSRKYGGTGLGLAIVKKLVLMMNGKIELRSELGIGSEFTVVLPFQPEDLHTSVDRLQREWDHANAR